LELGPWLFQPLGFPASFKQAILKASFGTWTMTLPTIRVSCIFQAGHPKASFGTWTMTLPNIRVSCIFEPGYPDGFIITKLVLWLWIHFFLELKLFCKYFWVLNLQ
jgi:hypothetical protein